MNLGDLSLRNSIGIKVTFRIFLGTHFRFIGCREKKLSLVLLWLVVEVVVVEGEELQMESNKIIYPFIKVPTRLFNFAFYEEVLLKEGILTLPWPKRNQ